MPRIPNSLIRKARAIDRLLPPLLGVCRDLRTAENELRWLRDYAAEKKHVAKRITRNSLRGNGFKMARVNGSVKQRSMVKGGKNVSDTRLEDLVRKRARGWPLQYLLGSEYFGDLEIICRPGVLIPRYECCVSFQGRICQKCRKS
jgi:hypothetical protein